MIKNVTKIISFQKWHYHKSTQFLLFSDCHPEPVFGRYILRHTKYNGSFFSLKRIQINVFNYVDNVLNWRKNQVKMPNVQRFFCSILGRMLIFFLLFLLPLPAAVVLFVFWLLFSFHFIWLLLHVPLQFKINDNWILNNWIEHSACMVCNVCART